jgi:hypothetical protein
MDVMVLVLLVKQGDARMTRSVQVFFYLFDLMFSLKYFSSETKELSQNLVTEILMSLMRTCT